MLFRYRKKNDNYEEFSDTHSLASTIHSTGTTNEHSKPDIARPKMNIEELKKSEKRLQEMLNAPTENISPHSSSLDNNVQQNSNDELADTIINIPQIEKYPPIVIQSIDKLKDDEHPSEDEDEFGEIKVGQRRKSVVTFNENVEKIIHVEDNLDDADGSEDYQVDRL